MPIYESDPDRRPDAEFEPGRCAHLVLAAEGRLLDARRTPVRIVDLCDRTGQFTVEILAFEDAGARWVLPYEDVHRFQFEQNGPVNDAARITAIEAVTDRFDRPMAIVCDPQARARTHSLLDDQTRETRSWLDAHSVFLADAARLPDPERREGDPRLFDDFARCLAERDLWGMEDAFATTFVSAPFGEFIKGHKIVIAELGLVPYDGKIIRDESLFDEPWSRARRANHILARLAFLRALAAALRLDSFTLYRGLSTTSPLRPPRNETFVSTTFSRTVAECLFDAHGPNSTGLLVRHTVPVARIFMTYLETIHMNRRFKEAEAILLHDERNPAF